jgi:SAM-dependent methyltransferase
VTVSSRPSQQCSTVDEAIEVLRAVVADQDGGDLGYFDSQLDRFRHTAGRIHALSSPGSRILDVGSHYLHQAAILKLLGHDVTGVDISLFSTAEFVVQRSRQLNIPNLTITNLEDGKLLLDGGYENSFDVIVFTAILEHITFNPVTFWRRIYDLLRPGGKIYVTTPNGLRPKAMVRHLLRLVTFEGVGIPVKDVLGTITYGHHWKEYSSTELRQYFQRLSPDFRVDTNWYDDSGPRSGARGAVLKALSRVPMFRPEIEAVVSLSGKSGRFVATPQLPMATKSPRGPRE